MQRDLVVVILYDSTYNQYKICKNVKIANITNIFFLVTPTENF